MMMMTTMCFLAFSIDTSQAPLVCMSSFADITQRKLCAAMNAVMVVLISSPIYACGDAVYF
jgi:hypothetical protein